MRTAQTTRVVAAGLLELEQATLWSAVDARWRQRRDPWIGWVKSIR
jgi:hypothetical protein